MTQHTDIPGKVSGRTLRGRAFFANLVAQANLPDDFRSQVADPWTGNAGADARQLFDWALSRGVNPAEPQNTTLGSLLLQDLPSKGLDYASVCAALIVKYKLIVGSSTRERFAKRYQIPMADAATPEEEPRAGPTFDWIAPDDAAQLQLQGLFRADPVDLSVEFLRQAIVCASGICRIEIDGEPNGTGFLISPDIAITNYHVLGQNDGEVQASIAKTKLRFGAFTNAKADEADGQLVGVEPSALLCSNVEEYDFVLLRADRSIRNCKGLTPAILGTATPSLRTGLNILHHPRGGPMKLCISSRGVAAVIAKQGKLQYASRTAGGSSGSPCFDDEFRVVAIHHAACSKTWGVAGEGILIAVINEALQQYIS